MDLARGVNSVWGRRMEAATTTAPRPATRATERRLPPGPPLPKPLQTAIWSRQARRMLYACQDRYGDIFTIRIAHEGTWVVLAGPDAIKQVFTGDPKVFHAGEGNQVLATVLGQLFVRASERAERIYDAMCARGWK